MPLSESDLRRAEKQSSDATGEIAGQCELHGAAEAVAMCRQRAWTWDNPRSA